jgi:hypothetical protein
MDARLARLDGDEDVATALRAEVNGEGRRRKLEDLSPRASDERGPEFFDDLFDEFFVHACRAGQSVAALFTFTVI